MSDAGIARAAERVASASRALDAGADDLRAAARRRLMVRGAAAVLEAEAEKMQTLARVVAKLEQTSE
jgi:hypothetical protein